jgi:uridine kinase
LTGINVDVKAHYLALAREVTEITCEKMRMHDGIFTIAVGGESGSGKSTLSLAIKSVLKDKGYQTFIFHLDDYYYLPPKDTHERRVQDLSSVGPEEVNLDLLQQHMHQVNDGAKYLRKPLASYRENQIYEVIAEVEDVKVVIAEGTYALLLEEIDCKIFMLRNYIETYQNRVKRARDPIIPLYEQILEIEHNIIKNHVELADIVIDKDYNMKVASEKFNEAG